jgi:hypothetical protein
VDQVVVVVQRVRHTYSLVLPSGEHRGSRRDSRVHATGSGRGARPLRDDPSANDSARVRARNVAEAAVCPPDRGLRPPECLPQDVRNDTRRRTAADDEVDRTSARQLCPRVRALIENNARQHRRKPSRDASERAPGVRDGRLRVRAPLANDVRHFAQRIDIRLERQVVARLWVPKTRFHALASWEADPVG